MTQQFISRQNMVTSFSLLPERVGVSGRYILIYNITNH